MIQDTIKNRRSIRSYTGQAVTDEQLHAVLEAGFYAPTARNLQPTHFIIIKDPQTLETIAQEQPNARHGVGAGCGILVCGDRSLDVDGYLAENASAAIQNMMLCAHELGLGTVWCGVYPRTERTEGFRRICQLPESILPVGFLVIGVPNEEKPVPDRFDPARIHKERW